MVREIATGGRVAEEGRAAGPAVHRVVVVVADDGRRASLRLANANTRHNRRNFHTAWAVWDRDAASFRDGRARNRY